MLGPGRLAPARAHPTLRLPAATAPALLVGRSRGCDVVLDDPTVSGSHAALMLFGGRWYVSDRGSTNGTSVNGRRIWGTVTVEPGDRVSFGLATFRLVVPD
jgi:pSer/pThr/pTyr-binding forkhead associated (FHA) protein